MKKFFCASLLGVMAVAALLSSQVVSDARAQERRTPTLVELGEKAYGTTFPKLKVKYFDAEPKIAGKPVLVEFWATWCPPCRISIPHLNKVQAKYRDKGLVIIGITQEGADEVTPFRKSIKMDYTVASEPDGNLSTQLGVDAIPHAFLLDKQGKVAWQGSPFELTDEIIEKVL